jgi:uncharacterized protein
MSVKSRILWVDLENSPHVPFFKPIIEELEKHGYQVVITARDCFQVCGLADMYGLSYKRIGRHYGKNKLLKVIGAIIRAMQMSQAINKPPPALAIAHGSRSQLLAAKMLHIPSMQLADYEHSNKLPSFFSSDWLMIPETIPTGLYWRNPSRISTYPGIKEDVYVPNFKPEAGILESLGITEEDIVVTIRPPASEAHYHNPKSDDLFHATIDWLSDIDRLRMVVLPRNEHQANHIYTTWPALISNQKIILPDRVLDGLNLIWHSDLVISGGGTMNREAAALGVPVYSIFRGEIGAIDKYLESTGRLTLLETADELSTKVIIKKWERPISPTHKPRPALNVIVTKVLELAGNNLI